MGLGPAGTRSSVGGGCCGGVLASPSGPLGTTKDCSGPLEQCSGPLGNESIGSRLAALDLRVGKREKGEFPQPGRESHQESRRGDGAGPCSSSVLVDNNSDLDSFEINRLSPSPRLLPSDEEGPARARSSGSRTTCGDRCEPSLLTVRLIRLPRHFVRLGGARSRPSLSSGC